MREQERLREKERMKDLVVVANLDADEQLLKKIGDQKYASQGQNVFVDRDFTEPVASGTDEEFPSGLHYDSFTKI